MNRPKLFRAQEWIIIGVLLFFLFSMLRNGVVGVLFGLGIWLPLTIGATVLLYFVRRRKLKAWDRLNDPANYPPPPPPAPTGRIAANRDDDVPQVRAAAAAASNARAAERDVDQAERARRMREGE